ncbi:sulfatase-like hydrolase/transferase [Actinocorallia populi]|uniref:sulfatase-like hydrolase/transferase n=1 Tax=Actinocorallia populi TaxID=2079200 RepID=UPI000D0961A0|nr:sulfatase-like hydrolase/transferase [Actinocorallia populi]
MKAIMVMFDSLNRRFLPPYGAEGVHAPNFTRLAERTATFDTCYGGSMPCMPARREMHTGRHNFLHRGWGPLEPFDDSVPEILKEHGVYTHLVTDHQHYWLDGGATYHPRYNTFELFRGQEGDEWKGHVADPDVPESVAHTANPLRRQDWINRLYLTEEADHPQTQTFDAGMHFIRTNHTEDDWFLQIETFDPHEPFFSYDDYKKLYPDDYDGPHFDWPDYKRVTETPEQVAHLRNQYMALLSMCDRSLGRVLDLMDDLSLWEDTLLVVCTDHGLLLGEHDWWGKNTPPFWGETIHTPLFVWDPRSRVAGERRKSLVQTIDFGPTLLEFFGIDRTPDMRGMPLRHVVAEDIPVRDAGLFGCFGGHVSVTDGRYVYMRACATQGNQPLAEYTLMPTHMRGRFPVETLRHATLTEPFSFTKGVATLRVPGYSYTDPYAFGTLLYDLENDPEQRTPLIDDDLELRMATLLTRLLRIEEAPPEQYERLGLPRNGPVTRDHLLVQKQWEQVQAAERPPLTAEEFPSSRLGVLTPTRDLLTEPAAEAVLRRHLGALMESPMLPEALPFSLLEISELATGLISRETLHAIAEDLAGL